MSKRSVILFAGVIAISAVIGWNANTFVAIDACLDDGGRWFADKGFCGMVNHSE